MVPKEEPSKLDKDALKAHINAKIKNPLGLGDLWKFDIREENDSFDNPPSFYVGKTHDPSWSASTLRPRENEGIPVVRLARGFKRYFRLYPRCKLPVPMPHDWKAVTKGPTEHMKFVKTMDPCVSFLGSEFVFGPINRGGFSEKTVMESWDQIEINFNIDCYCVWSFSGRKVNM